MASQVERKLDHVIAFITERSSEIESAVEKIGVPFDVCVCAAVQKAIRVHDSDSRQLDLFDLDQSSRKRR
jgi:hypothetical protein